MSATDHLNGDQFFHGTRHKLKPGQVLTGGHAQSNQGYGQPGEHVYFSQHKHIAGVFAEAGNGPEHDWDAKPRVYQVHPVDAHEPDPLESPEVASFRSKRVKVVKEIRGNWG